MSKKKIATTNTTETEAIVAETDAATTTTTDENYTEGRDVTADRTAGYTDAGRRVVSGFSARWHGKSGALSLNDVVHGRPAELAVDSRVQVVEVTMLKFKLDGDFIGAKTLQERGMLEEIDAEGAEERYRIAQEEKKATREAERATREVAIAMERAKEAQAKAEEKIAKIKADAEKRVAELKAKGAKFTAPKTGKLVNA